MHLPLNALRAFDSAARHLNLTRAAHELHVTQTAVSQHIRKLEEQLGTPLFRRLPRGLALTDEGQALWPVVADCFGRLERALGQLRNDRPREVLTWAWWARSPWAGCCPGWPTLRPATPISTCAADPQQPRGPECRRAGRGHPLWRRCLARPASRSAGARAADPAVRPGHCRAPAPAGRSARPDLAALFRTAEWEQWCQAAEVATLRAAGPQFDSSIALAEAAAQGAGVALLPPAMFTHLLRAGRLVQPFALTVPAGAYWFTQPRTRAASPALEDVRQWLLAQAQTA
jgi:LysR family transcriptional regulator of beta-lactamase